ncbi:hypothetical protein AB0J83_47075 [Actinoplanes sp. NPDC049596]
MPRQRGAASVPPPAPPTGPASRGTQYGGPPPEYIEDDFGASNGYLDAPQPPATGVYGSQAAGSTYGAPAPSQDQYAPGYEGDQGYYDEGYPEATGYGGPTEYGRPADHDEAAAYDHSGEYGRSATYGRPAEYDQAAEYGPAPVYDQPGYGPPGGYDEPAREPGATTGDPTYRAKRHRPSANDTNIGSLADFASYPAGSDEHHHSPRGY